MNMKAIFLTEREAKEFIVSNFGEKALIKNSEIDDTMSFDIDEMPFDWAGTASAFEVNGGEALIGFWEASDAEYTISFKGVEEKTDSIYRAREIADSIRDLAEDNGLSGEIIIKSKYDEEIVEVDSYEEEEGNLTDFINEWNRKKIGEAIKKARTAKGWSIRELATQAGMSKNNVERIEKGLYNYTIDNLNSISKSLNLSLKITHC